jgi:hypothetical protein
MMSNAMTVKELIHDLLELDMNMEVWLEDEASNYGLLPLNHVDEVGDDDLPPGEPKLCLGLFHSPARSIPAWPGDR